MGFVIGHQGIKLFSFRGFLFGIVKIRLTRRRDGGAYFRRRRRFVFTAPVAAFNAPAVYGGDHGRVGGSCFRRPSVHHLQFVTPERAVRQLHVSMQIAGLAVVLFAITALMPLSLVDGLAMAPEVVLIKCISISVGLIPHTVHDNYEVTS